METFEPTNDVEVFLKRAAAGEISNEELLPVLVQSQMYAACVNDPSEDPSKFVPMLFDRNGEPFAAVFTSLPLINLFSTHIKGSVAMNCGEILARTPPGYGVVINPGYEIGLELHESGIRKIIADFVRRPA
ncbi:MAG: SseB family protein [Burkholderiales bacterium]